MGANTRDAPDLSGLFFARRRRDNPLVKQSPNEAGSVVLGDLFFEAAAGGTTIACTVGNAVAAGTAATINAAFNLACTPANAVANGIVSAVNQATVIACNVGAAVADGVAAQVNQAVNLTCVVGNAAAAGVTADITIAGGAIAIDCTPGAAVAAGVAANINQAINLQCATGNAVADGVPATITLAGGAIDVRVSWAEFDTVAASCDVRVSWCEFDTQAASCDVRVSWCEFDPNAIKPEAEQSGGAFFGYDWFAREKRRKAREVPDKAVGIVENVVLRAIEQTKTRDRTKDLETAQALLVADLARLNLDLNAAILALLRIEYDLWLAEQEEAAIVMLLFEM